MSTAALEEGELDTTDLSAGLLLDDVGQLYSQTAQLGVPKPSVAEVSASETKRPSA